MIKHLEATVGCCFLMENSFCIKKLPKVIQSKKRRIVYPKIAFGVF